MHPTYLKPNRYLYINQTPIQDTFTLHLKFKYPNNVRCEYSYYSIISGGSNPSVGETYNNVMYLSGDLIKEFNTSINCNFTIYGSGNFVCTLIVTINIYDETDNSLIYTKEYSSGLYCILNYYVSPEFREIYNYVSDNPIETIPLDDYFLWDYDDKWKCDNAYIIRYNFLKSNDSYSDYVVNIGYTTSLPNDTIYNEYNFYRHIKNNYKSSFQVSSGLYMENRYTQLFYTTNQEYKTFPAKHINGGLDVSVELDKEKYVVNVDSVGIASIFSDDVYKCVDNYGDTVMLDYYNDTSINFDVGNLPLSSYNYSVGCLSAYDCKNIANISTTIDTLSFGYSSNGKYYIGDFVFELYNLTKSDGTTTTTIYDFDYLYEAGKGYIILNTNINTNETLTVEFKKYTTTIPFEVVLTLKKLSYYCEDINSINLYGKSFGGEKYLPFSTIEDLKLWADKYIQYNKNIKTSKKYVKKNVLNIEDVCIGSFVNGDKIIGCNIDINKDGNNVDIKTGNAIKSALDKLFGE